MKRITTMLLFTLAVFAAVGNVSAQDHAVKASVPFHFTVGTKMLPPGSYTITSDIASPKVVVIRNGEQNIAILSSVYADGNDSKKNVLVFNKYGDQYFLHEILCSSSGMNLELPASKLEKKVQHQEARLQGGGDQILVALK
jgi:hypothetical protein